VNPGWLTAADESFRDYATFDPNLAVPNVITGTAPTGQGISTYGPLLMRLVADYQGPIVWGEPTTFSSLYLEMLTTLFYEKASIEVATTSPTPSQLPRLQSSNCRPCMRWSLVTNL
jgi:hypothetical protein